jgi:hypothetical protein
MNSPENSTGGEVPTAGVNYEAPTFVVLMVSSGVVAWQLGFELGAFETIDYRWLWLVWVLSVVALVSSVVFRGSTFDIARPWQFVLVIPTVRVVVDFFVPVNGAVSLALDIASAATLPLTLYILARLLAWKFFELSWRTQVIGAALVVGIFLTGWLVGDSHRRYLTCYDFIRAGDYVPADCTPANH